MFVTGKSIKAVVACLYGLLFLAPQVYADNQDEARKLLRVTNVAERFEQATAMQTAAIVRTFASIVNMSSDVILPLEIRRQISACYQEEFAWSRFESGFAEIFAANMSADELTLLIDFYSARSIPPPRINQFKQLINKADAIELQASEFMFAQTESCDRNSLHIIRAFLTEDAN